MADASTAIVTSAMTQALSLLSSLGPVLVLFVGVMVFGLVVSIIVRARG